MPPSTFDVNIHTGDTVDHIGNKVDRIGNEVHRDNLLNSRCCQFVTKTGNKVDCINNEVDYVYIGNQVDFVTDLSPLLATCVPSLSVLLLSGRCNCITSEVHGAAG